MVSFSTAFVSAAAILGMVQYCPAPFAAIPVLVTIDLGSAAAWAGAAGGITGGAAGAATAIENGKKSKSKRDFNSRITRRQDANELAWKECHSDLQSATVGFSSPATSSILVTGIPATCMTLSTVITGKYDEGNPVPEGSDSILFNNVSDDTITEIQNALTG